MATFSGNRSNEWEMRTARVHKNAATSQDQTSTLSTYGSSISHPQTHAFSFPPFHSFVTFSHFVIILNLAPPHMSDLFFPRYTTSIPAPTPRNTHNQQTKSKTFDIFIARTNVDPTSGGGSSFTVHRLQRITQSKISYTYRGYTFRGGRLKEPCYTCRGGCAEGGWKFWIVAQIFSVDR